MQPIDMVLYCPICGLQHIDAPSAYWTNPPHRSHLCAGCGHIWRAADVPTNGVRRTKTAGEHDAPHLPTAVLLRPGSKSSHRELFGVYEQDPPGSGVLLLVDVNSDPNVVNGAWQVDVSKGAVGCTLLGYVEVQEGYRDGENPPEYEALLELFKEESRLFYGGK